MWDKKYKIHITVGRGTKEMPEYIEGMTIQCKNCGWWGDSQHCGVMPSERMGAESWCATVSPKQFFKPIQKTFYNKQ